MPPVYDKIVARNEIGISGGQKHGGTGNIRWVAGSPERDFLDKISFFLGIT